MTHQQVTVLPVLSKEKYVSYPPEDSGMGWKIALNSIIKRDLTTKTVKI
jgi:hypothetical protein